MITSLLLLGAGLVGLIVGSELAVSAATRLARWLGVSSWVVGLTIASIGTSLPEISTNIAAAWSTRAGVDASELAVGNVVGSCLSQITLLLGFTAILSPLVLPRGGARRDMGAAIVALLLMGWMSWDGVVDWNDALILIGAYGVYLVIAVLTADRPPPAKERPRFGLWQALKGVIGLGIVVVGADAVVTGGVSLAEALGLGRTTIGLMVGLGTGLPELAIAVRAVLAGSGSLSLGNLIGSNITDPLLTLGSGALIHPLTVRHEVLIFDLPIWLGCTLLALLFLVTGRRLTRFEGLLLVLVFFAYVLARAMLSSAWMEGVGFHTLPWA